MNNRKNKAKATLALTCTLLLTSKVHAHFPTLYCELLEKQSDTLSCEAGYSDASLAGLEELNVYSYDDELLNTVTTATDGSALIKKPMGEFYIVFDPGHESPAEFDYAELP